MSLAKPLLGEISGRWFFAIIIDCKEAAVYVMASSTSFIPYLFYFSPELQHFRKRVSRTDVKLLDFVLQGLDVCVKDIEESSST